MKPSLLLITVSWFGSASLQHITSEPGHDFDPYTRWFESDYQYPPPHYRPMFRSPAVQTLDASDNNQLENVIFKQEDKNDVTRARRTIGNFDKEADDWLVNQIDDAERSSYYSDRNALIPTPKTSENSSDVAVDDLEKRNFSPWGGKRDKPIFDSKWYWKRAENIKEPSMPSMKRVRFSPWGGKRSGQVIYKAEGKIIPEFTNEMEAILPTGERLNIAGIQLLDKRHPIKVLTLSTDGGLMRKAMPFKSILEQLPKFFKIGHPYSNVNLKKDGKRKVKFSAWGGKRSPPIIGPIWTPAPSDVKESTLNAILLIRNNLHKLDKMPA